MANTLTVPASPRLYTTYYANLKGVDLYNAPTETNRSHAADILNMMLDPDGGFPCKRVGWRYFKDLRESSEGSYVDTKVLAAYHDVTHNCDLIGTERKLWHYNCETEVWTVIRNSLTASTHCTITRYEDNVYISMFGTMFYMTPDNMASPALNGYTEISPTNYAAGSGGWTGSNYIPTTVIAKKPDGTGGTALQGVNLLSTVRIEQFRSDQAPDSTTDAAVNWYIVPSTVWSDRLISIKDVQFMTDEGVWESGEEVDLDNVNPQAWHWTMYEPIYQYINHDHSAVTLYDDINGTTTTTWTQTAIGIRFLSQSGSHLKQKVPGQDSVRIIYEEFDARKDADNICYGRYSPMRSALMKTDIIAKYGNVSMDRFFYAVDNKIYYSEPEQPWFIPDDNYLVVGNGTPIVGLHKYNYALAAVTKDTAEHTIYMIQERTLEQSQVTYDSSGVASSKTETIYYFQLRPTVAGTGAVAKKSFGTLVDDPLFLAKTGIYGISTQTYTSNAVIVNRSRMINQWLMQEANLEEAACGIWKGMYLLAVNNHVYALDSNNNIRVNNENGYECYYWENVPATLFLSYDGNLFFATADGRWCRFNTDLAAAVAYSDGGTWDDVNEEMVGGTAIHARYALPIDHDGLPQRFKKLQKKGFAVVLYPYSKSGAKIYYEKDGTGEKLVADVAASITTFDNVDFEDFSFETTDTARFVYPKKKVKKYKTLQLIVENDNLNEQFGLISVTKTYIVQNFAKGV